MPDTAGQRRPITKIIDGISCSQLIRTGIGAHGEIDHLEPFKPVLPAQLDAAIEMILGPAHLPAQVVGVPQSAQRPRLGLRLASQLTKVARLLVLVQAIICASHRKIKIAAQVMNIGKLGVQCVGFGRDLSPIEEFQAFIHSINDAHATGQTNPRPALGRAVRCAGEGLFKGTCRPLYITQLAQGFASEKAQPKGQGRIIGKARTTCS